MLSVGAGVSATLSDLILADGQSSEGGDLYVAAGADVHLNRVALLNGVATLRGGAAYLAAGASMQMTDSEIAGSRADVAGGGIYSEGALDLSSSSIHDNQSTSLVVGRGRGGGIYVAGSLNASNTTIANNTATLRGGGLYAEQGAQTLLNLTIAGNVAATGGGAYVDVADLTLHNTVIGDNFRAAGAVRDDLFGSIDPASSYSFLASGAGSSGIDDGVNGNRVGSAAAPIDPRFLPLGFYGGFTPTVALRADSPLLDAGSAAASPGLIQDQRGQPRVMDFDEDGTASIDIGAYEANPRILVDALNDESTDTDGKTSLREALAQADAQPGLDIIQIASSLLTGGSAQVALGLGELVIGSDARIEGPADGKVSIHAAAASRVVTISAGASVTMTNLTLTDGVGIDGGAIDNHGNLTVDGVLFVGNTATGDGGAIINNAGATLTLLNTTISGNSANGRGGAIFQAGGTMTLVNATIYNNVADADDSGDPAAAGGIHVAAGTATLSNTVAAGNHRGSASPAAADVAGAFAASSSFNFIGAIDGSTGLLGAGTQSGTSASPIDPRMNPLADNGGPTMTHSVLAGSPLTDSGNDSLASAAGLTADQRGLPRFKDGNDDHIDRVDIGAFEQQFSLNQAPILTSIATILGAAEARTFTIRYDLLLQSSDAVDPDAMAQPISFRIMSVLQGTLAYNGAPVVPGITLLGAGGSLVWTPPALNFGDNSSLTIPAFTVAAFDGALNSASPVQVKIEVTSAAEPVNYAVLFSGGDSPDFNFPYYYSNLKSLYQTITTRYGVKPQNIYVVYADGRDPASDMKGGVNGDMTFAQNVLSATSDNLRTTLLSLSQLADANDHFLFWCYDHGFGATDQPSIHDEELVKGWGGDEVISNDQLRVWLQGLSGSDSEATYDVPAGYQGIRAGYNTYVFSQCFAGGPLDSLSLDSTHFGMAASNHYEASYADNFAAAFNAALGAGYATTDATFSYAFAHDGRAADGGRNGGAWQFNVEHPWSDGGNFPIFAGISGQNSTPVFNSIAPLRCNSAATSLTITYDMLKAAADASDPSGQSLRFRITSVNVGTILRNGVPINLSDPAQTTIGFGDSVVWQRPGGSTGLLSGVFGIVAVASDGTISATRQASIRIGSPAGGPTAADDARTLQYNSVAALLDPLANDGGVGKRVLRVGVASHGIVTLDSVTGQVRYTPAVDYVGADVFTYLITDGIVTDIASFSLNVVPFDPSVLNSSNYRWTITELDPAPRWAGLPQSWDWTYRSSLTDWASSSAVDISNDGAVLVRITRPDQPNGLLDYVGSTNAAYRWYAGSGDPFWNYVLTGSGASQTAQTSTNTLVLLRGTASTQNGRQVFDGVDASHVGGGNVMPGIAYDPGNGMDGLTNIAGFAGGGGFWYDVGSGAEFWQDLPADIIPVDISSGATNDATYWGAMTNTGQLSGAVQHAELWHFSRNTVSSMISLPGWAGSHASQAYAINGAGMAVGWAEYQSGDYRAFLHNGSGMIHLAVLGSYTESAAYSINDAGVAVGFSGSSVQSDQSGIATLWQSGAATSLGTIGGGGWSVARDINNSNMVVGASNGHAFVWISGTMYDLNSMLQGALPGVVLTSANAINDAGQIAATGTVAGQTRGFFLDLRSLLQASADTVPWVLAGTAQFNVLANDTGSNLSIVSVNTTGMLGTLVWSADGSMTYDPAGAFANLAPGQSASTSFSYLATDSWGATATVTVTINLTAAAVSRPSAPQLMTAWDSGISSSDGLTRYNNSAPSQVMHFNIGNTVAGATVQLFADGILIGQATAASSSTEITTNGTLLLSDGPHLITSVQILPSNAASAASDPFVIVVDAHAPAVTGTFEYLSQQRLVLHLDDNPSGTLSADDLQLVNLSTSQTVPGSTLIMSFDPGTNTATFRVNGYGGMLPDGNYRLTLPAGSIADAAGNALSVAWSMDFFVLGGDADHNRMVDLNDLYILASNWRGSGKVFNQGDFNYDGKVDAKDLGILSINWQRSLPVPAPAPPLTALRRAPTRSPVRVISLVDPQSAT
ncbi:MAG TPA: choice-of-anchor Q domain-containing protein [Dongiaceae bacterium]|nr:choice-of-anchor Q domain-containing protein [Dongiaceae bacterium]